MEYASFVMSTYVVLVEEEGVPSPTVMENTTAEERLYTVFPIRNNSDVKLQTVLESPKPGDAATFTPANESQRRGGGRV